MHGQSFLSLQTKGRVHSKVKLELNKLVVGQLKGYIVFDSVTVVARRVGERLRWLARLAPKRLGGYVSRG